MWEEALTEEELGKIEADKAVVAEKKKAEKAKKQAELDAKFNSAVASHEIKEENPKS